MASTINPTDPTYAATLRQRVEQHDREHGEMLTAIETLEHGRSVDELAALGWSPADVPDWLASSVA